MLRDKNLIPLSHQHQHALALCVRIGRASPVPNADLEAWQAEIVQIFQGEIRIHFAAEEQVLFPAAKTFQELFPLVEELLADHVALRELFGRAEKRSFSAPELSVFGEKLSAHIRKEERLLFERMQQLMNQEELARLGGQLDDVLKQAAQACVLPTDATKLRPAR